MIPDDVIQHLIELGSLAEGNLSRRQHLLSVVAPYDEINRRHWADWIEVSRPLATESLICLIRGLTLAEKYNGWTGGSVSSVIWTFQELERRQSPQLEPLAAWILSVSKNPYVPFGRVNLGARSYDEYQTLRSRKEMRAVRHRQREQADQERAAVERVARAEQRLRAAARRQLPVRAEFLRHLQTLSIVDQLTLLANDPEYPANWYPTCLARAATEPLLRSLPEELKQMLAVKMKGRQRGPWVQFKRRLRAVLAERVVPSDG